MARPRSLGFRLSVAVGGWLAAWALRALGATWRVRQAGDDPLARGARTIGALWHEGLLAAAWRFRSSGVVIPVSQSRDGDRIVAVLAHLGFGPAPRGSSSRGGAAALAGLIRAAEEGRSLAVLCDGPRGPARACKPGVVAAARASGLPLQPLGFAADPAVRFPSWDRTVLPLPFARVAFVFGPPLTVPPDLSDADREALHLRLEAANEHARSEAEALIR
jgi:lysophospholipid acyltransferase (LPLAT)-like uncharacterized protein